MTVNKPIRKVAPPAGAKRTLQGPPRKPGEYCLTESEQAHLSERGWKADGGPGALEAAVRKLRQESENLPPPVPLDTPPISPNIREEHQLSAEDRKRLEEGLQLWDSQTPAPTSVRGLTRNLAQKKAPTGPPKPTSSARTVSDVQDAMRFLAESDPGDTEETQETPPETKPEPDPVEEHDPEEPHKCPHCHWDLNRSDIPQPTPEDEEAFFHHLLGGTFEKAYSLWEGKAEVVFRTLTMPELDAVVEWSHRTSMERYTDLIHAIKFVPQEYQVAVLNQASRYRMALQLVSLRTATSNVTFPRGLSQATNPEAGSWWDGTVVEVEKELMSHDLKNESLFRAVLNKCASFNRLVAALESRYESENFT